MLALVPFLLIETKLTALLGFYSYFPILELLRGIGLPVFGKFESGMVMAPVTKAGIASIVTFWLAMHFVLACIFHFVLKFIRSYSVVVGVVATQLPSSAHAVAALPPVSGETMQAAATTIVVGTVLSIKTSVVKMENGWSNTLYDISIDIQVVVKGSVPDLTRPLIVHAWRAHNRPNGWTGPSGHYGMDDVKRGQKLRFFLDDTAHILEPNGLQSVALISAPVVSAQVSSDPCQFYSETECIESSVCKLVPMLDAPKGQYACRRNRNACEEDFIQSRSGKVSCESKAHCSYQPGSCYCPPGLQCRCGGGRPAMCVPS